MNKPVLKKKTSIGVHTLPTEAIAYQAHGLVVTHVTFEQNDRAYKNLSVTLEDGTTLPLEWFRADRYGKKHLETEPPPTRVAPFIKGCNFSTTVSRRSCTSNGRIRCAPSSPKR